jgi:hypothetical protein
VVHRGAGVKEALAIISETPLSDQP